MTTGSITAATQVVNLSQPAISRLIAVMEAELGFKLFYRQGRRLIPSVEGRSFFLRIEGTLSGIDDIDSIANDIRYNKEGRLRLCAMGPLLFSRLLPNAIASYRSAYPETQLTVEMRRREDIDEWVASRQADLGFTLMPVESKSVSSEQIVTVAAVGIVPKDHRLADQKVLSLSDFENETLILPKQSIRLRQIVDAEILRGKRSVAVDIETSTALASCHLVAQGVGVGVSDPFSFSGVGREHIAVSRWEPAITLTYCAIWPKDREPTDQTRRFLDVVRSSAEIFLNEYPEARPQ